MRLAVALVLGLSTVCAQTCVPTPILPTTAIPGTLDDSSCVLSDGTPYAVYRLDLPVRGAIRIDLSAPNAGLILRDNSGARIDAGSTIRRPIESGTYSLLVNGRAAGEAVSYMVRAAFTPEPGMLCTAFPGIGLNHTVTATLGASGCVMPDGTLYDAYLLETAGSGTLTVSLSSPDFTTALILRDSDGYAIASDAAQVSVPVDGNSRYQVVVTTSGQRGSYQLITAFQTADGETCRPRWSFTGPGIDTGSITPDSCSATMPGGDTARYNFYSFTVEAAGLVDLSATSPDFAATLILLDEAGNLIASDTGSHADIRLHLAPGNYTARVFSALASGGAYTFSYEFAPGPPQPCTATPASPGDALAGVLSPASCRTSLGLADLYTFGLPSPGTLEIGLVTNSFTGLLAIRDAKDNLVLLSRDDTGSGLSQLTADLPAGAYTLAAGSASGAGTYHVTTKFTAHDISACAFVQPLSINGGYIQKLGPGSCRGPNGQAQDLYSFTMPSDGVVAGFLTSGQIDGLLTLSGSGGNFLRSDDNTYGESDSMLVQFLPAGDYLVSARAAGNSAGGYYEVDLRSVLTQRPPFCGSKGRMTPGGTISGALSIASCQYTDGTFADLYEIDLASDATVDIRLSSGDFDAYLVLLDAKGNVVDQDDDSGGNTDALVSRALSAGVWFVVAKPAAGYSHIGAYLLSLDQQ